MLEGTIEPIDLDIAAIINEELSPAARSAALVAFARETLTDAEKQNSDALGFVPGHVTTVDGVAGVDEDKVKPGGEIDYAFQLLPDLFGWILAMLEQFAPVRSGFFKASFDLFADGHLIDPSAEIPQAFEYVFLSSAVYASKIEGDQSRRPESRQAPNGVFEAVATLAQQHFGNQISIRFSYREPFSPINEKYRQPAITITLGA